MNLATRIRWPAEDADERLAALDDRMREDGRWPSLVVSSALTEPTDLVDRLEKAGWARVGSLNDHVHASRPCRSARRSGPARRGGDGAHCRRVDPASHGCVSGSPKRPSKSARSSSPGRSSPAPHERSCCDSFTSRWRPPAWRWARAWRGSTASASSARHRRRGYGRMITAVATRAGLVTGHSLVWLSVDENNVGAIELYESLGFELTFCLVALELAPDR